MANPQENPRKRIEESPGNGGQIAFIAGAGLILCLGLFILWPSEAPYHPDADGRFDKTVTLYDAQRLE